jgi:hypothetical protein
MLRQFGGAPTIPDGQVRVETQLGKVPVVPDGQGCRRTGEPGSRQSGKTPTVPRGHDGCSPAFLRQRLPFQTVPRGQQ